MIGVFCIQAAFEIATGNLKTFQPAYWNIFLHRNIFQAVFEIATGSLKTFQPAYWNIFLHKKSFRLPILRKIRLSNG